MKRWIACLLALSLPGSAFAMGIGTTGYFGQSFWWGGAGAFGPGFGLGSVWLPSLDLYPTENIPIQIHAADTLAILIEDSDDIYLGGDVTFNVLRTTALPSMEGVIYPGGSLDLCACSGDTNIVLAGISRIGVEGGADMRLGVYLVPGVGIALNDGDGDMIWQGELQLSMWFGGGGGGTSMP